MKIDLETASTLMRCQTSVIESLISRGIIETSTGKSGKVFIDRNQISYTPDCAGTGEDFSYTEEFPPDLSRLPFGSLKRPADTLPSRSAVYIVLNERMQALYIGESAKLCMRIYYHNMKRWLRLVGGSRVAWVPAPEDKLLRLRLESKYILHFLPPFNIETMAREFKRKEELRFELWRKERNAKTA